MATNKVDGNKGYRKLPAVKITPKWEGPGDRSWPSSEIPARTIDAGPGIERCNAAYRGDGILMDHTSSARALSHQGRNAMSPWAKRSAWVR